VAIEKANISFQFALQIRNKLLEAYQEIMRMPV
jgi:flagellar hook-basal body complex protein FliE